MSTGLVELSHKFNGCKKVEVTKARPFSVNPRGVLVHRVRDVAVCHDSDGRYTHHTVAHYCGSQAHGVTLTNVPEPDAIVCASCERRCKELGLPEASEIVGRHVHIGGKRAFAFCHPEVVVEQPTHCSDCGRDLSEVGGGTCDTCR